MLREFSRAFPLFSFLGALICARIELRNVRKINYDELPFVRDTNAWWQNYDTIYYEHRDENKDEFCVKDPSQVLRWLIVILDDPRVKRFGLDQEFRDTICDCI